MLLKEQGTLAKISIKLQCK